MEKKKSILRWLIPLVLVLGALAALIVFVFVPIYSQKEDIIGRPPTVINYAGDGKALKMENDSLLFEMDGSTTQFQITDKISAIR